MDETISSVGTLASASKIPTKINQFKVLGKLGEGSFSTVYKVQRNADGKVYAMKKVRMSRLTEREKSNALNEIRILASVKSDHIVEYRDSFFDGSSDSLCIVMEYAEEGDLLQKLNEIKMQNKVNKEAKEFLLKTPSDKAIIPNVDEEDSVLSVGYVESNVKMEQKNKENSQKRSQNKFENNNTVLSRQLISTNKHDSVMQGQLPDHPNSSAHKQNAKNTNSSLQKSFSKTKNAEPNQNNSEQADHGHNSENYIFMPEEQVWDYLIQCTKGLECLHSMGIVHRDLKCANVLISQHNIVKIGDLNVSVVTRKASHLGKTHPGGTPFYTAPEVWQGHACDFKSDIWSLGCVAYELCAQIPPFQGNTLAGLCANILNGSFKRIPKIYSEELSNVINLCLTFQPRERPSSQDLLQLPIMQPYVKAYRERYSQYLKNTTTVQQYHGELEHLSPERRAKKCLLDQPHLIDTISLPSNLKRLSPLLPRAHYEDTLPLPTVAEFKVAGQNHENLGKSSETTDFEGGKELTFFTTKKDQQNNNNPQENYHDLVNHSPIRFTLKKVRMDESKFEEGSVICNTEGNEHADDKNEQKKQEEQVLSVIQRDSQIFRSEIATTNEKSNQKETKAKEETNNSSRIQMLSAYLEKLRTKVQKQPQVSQFGIASSYRDFENVFEFRQQPKQQRRIRTLSRDSSSNEERGLNSNKRQDNRVKFSFVSKNQSKNNRTQFVQEQQSQIPSDLVNYHIQSILNNNYQLNHSNIPANSSNISAASLISNNIQQRHLGQVNTSFIHNNPSSGSNPNKSSANFQKTLTTNDSMSNFSPPIASLRRTRRFISQHSSKNHNNSQNSKDDLTKKPKSSSPPQQQMSTQFSQVVKCYLPRTAAHQQRNLSSERQQNISVISSQRQISPPIVAKRAALSAKITTSKIAKSSQPCHSFHVKQTEIPVPDQGLKHLRNNDDNKENIQVSPNYPTVFPHRGLSSRINRQIKEPFQNIQNNQDTSRVLKLAQVCKKHKSNHEKQDKNIFYDHTREIFEDRTTQCQQHLNLHKDRIHNEKVMKIQSAQRQLEFLQPNKKLAFYQAGQMFIPKERKHYLFPLLR